MIIDETRQRAAPLKVDDCGLHSGQPHHVFVTADSKKLAVGRDRSRVVNRPRVRMRLGVEVSLLMIEYPRPVDWRASN